VFENNQKEWCLLEVIILYKQTNKESNWIKNGVTVDWRGRKIINSQFVVVIELDTKS